MEDKIKALNDYMKSLDTRLFVEEDWLTRSIDLCYRERDTDDIVLASVLYHYGDFIEPDKDIWVSEELFNELSQYNDNFFEKYNELFNKKEKEIEKQGNIEITNLDGLHKFINEASSLSNEVKNNIFRLHVKFEEIKQWKPEHKEKEEEKNKIDILNEYMNELDERLFVEKSCKDIDLCFKSKHGCKFPIVYISEGKLKYSLPGAIPQETFYELLPYKDEFFKKYNELFSEGDNKMESKKTEVTNLNELQELTKEVNELFSKVQGTTSELKEVIDKINYWKPVCKEKEKDKIDILNDYMQELDERLYVRKKYDFIYLKFKEKVTKESWLLAKYNIRHNKPSIVEPGKSPDDYHELMIYYKDFVGKANELYNK